MIYIDFQGGAHGNFLDFVCNKYLAGVPCNDLPFNDLGAAHTKIYAADKVFNNGHYSDYHGIKTELYHSKIISIQITTADLLPLQSISLLRAGDFNINNDELEVDTYHKLNNAEYKWILDNITASFFATQIQDSYNAVRDPSWPNVVNISDFQSLPEWIQAECRDMHNLRLLVLDQQHPDCPRHVLREFFKIGFKMPEHSGFMTQQQKMIYHASNDVLVFPFACFYDTDNFVKQITRISAWSGFDLKSESHLRELHKEFLQRQPYKHSKIFCDAIVDRILAQETFDLPCLDLLQESYILGRLEQHFAQELPNDQVKWFESSREILDLVIK